MALVSQILSVSYNAVLTDMRKAFNQWAESAFMRELERQGGIVRKSLGPQIEAVLDFQANPGTAFSAYDLQPTATTKTEVITSAVYDVAELSVPIVWSKKDEAMNPAENQKVALVKTLLENGINSHDDAIERAMFATSTNGFLGLPTFMTTAGTGSAGGIDAGTYTWWGNKSQTYVDDTDIEAAMTTAWNQAAKGSGSTMKPTMIVSDAATQALFEGTQQANQRYVDTQDLKAGFTTLAFKTGRYIFSQYAGTSLYMLNPKNLQLVVSREFFRDRGETQEFQNANGYVTHIYSALQLVGTNRSRLAIVHL